MGKNKHKNKTMSDIIDRLISCVRLAPQWMRPIIGILFMLLVVVTSPIWFPLFVGYAFFNAFIEDDDIHWD
jgi:hypothetical protein